MTSQNGGSPQQINGDPEKAAADYKKGDKPDTLHAYFHAIVEIRNGHPATICAECGREIDVSQSVTCCETGLYYCDDSCMMLDLSERKAAGEVF